MRQTAPLLIVPECSAPKCHHTGDQHAMIKCNACGDWYCEDHIEAAEGAPRERIAQVPTIKLVDTGWGRLAYNLGYCAGCRDKLHSRPPVDSTWLR